MRGNARGFRESAGNVETRHAEPEAGAMAKQRVGSNKADAHLEGPAGIAGPQYASHISDFVQVVQAALPYLFVTFARCNETSLCRSLLRNTRPHVVRTVCQIATELYKTVQCTQRPEFDELASTLLLKSTHTNKGIRNDAQRALDSMVSHLPPATCVRILTDEHGAR